MAAASAPSPASLAQDGAALRQGYAKRLKAPLADGHPPYIDIESSCNPQKLDLDDIAKALDSQHIGLMALSADIGKGPYERGVRYDPLNQRLLVAYPDRFVRLASRTGLAFQLHHELEDANFPPLEKMLTRYPKARVVWCHLAQIRYEERAPHYTADCVASPIQRFPQRSFDTAFGDATSVYPASGQRQARGWNAWGGLKDEWRDLIAAHPQCFLSALDLGGDRLERITSYDTKRHHFLAQLPKPVQEQVAYRNAWRLMFGEEFA